jgi:hypothetical protein
LYARAPTWGYDLVQLFAGDQRDPDFIVFLGLEKGGFRWCVGAVDGAQGLRDDAARWVVEWTEALAAAHVRLAYAHFGPHHQDYPRPVPPHSHDYLWLGVLDRWLGRAWHLGRPDGAVLLDRLERAELPAGARRSIDGDVTRISFDADLGDAASVAAARAAHERWITPVVDAPIELGWNAKGDRVVGPAKPVVREPLTWWDEWTTIGYKALVVFPETGVDEELWAQMAAIARAHALPDGTPVKSLRLIFPRREDALALHERALADGFEMTTYGENDLLWQVHPPPGALGGGTE